jgi:hypothetical protein
VRCVHLGRAQLPLCCIPLQSRQLPVLCHVIPLSQVTLRDAVGNDMHLAMLPVLYVGREWPVGSFLCPVLRYFSFVPFSIVICSFFLSFEIEQFLDHHSRFGVFDSVPGAIGASIAPAVLGTVL